MAFAPLRRLALPTGVVGVVRVEIGPEPASTELLSERERERAARFRSERAYREFVTVRTALRQVLGALLDQAPDRVAIGADGRGKPRLEGDDLHFNVTHTPGLGLIALASDREVGVDAELVDVGRVTRRLEQRVLAAAELYSIDALPPRERTPTFFRRWTCKEAAAKVEGHGIALAFDRVAVGEETLAGYPAPLAESSERFGEVGVAAMNVGPGYAAAVAAMGLDWRLVLHE